jgi:hypothetical protein
VSEPTRWYTVLIETAVGAGAPPWWRSWDRMGPVAWMPDGPPLHAEAGPDVGVVDVALHVLLQMPASVQPARVRVWPGQEADLSGPAGAAAYSDGQIHLGGRRTQLRVSRMLGGYRPGRVSLGPGR